MRHAEGVRGGRIAECSSATMSIQILAHQVLGWILLVASFGFASGWHAFVGQEATPTIPGTALRSGLPLPMLTKRTGENGMDECQMAETSFRRVLMICGNSSVCNSECAASWNSALRDSQGAIGSGCQTLETLVNSTFLFSVSVTPPFILQEWLTLQVRCNQFCGSFSGLFGLENPCQIDSTYKLAPPEAVCPSFKVTNGFFQYRVLTWETMKYYQDKDIGGAGGLSVLGGGEHSSWACVHEDTCAALAQADDLACYKYSHLRGEFHFWGLNSELELVPPLFRIDASFCYEDGDYALKNARNGTTVNILTAEYKMTRYNENNATDDVVHGMIRDLGNWGCGKFRLRKNARYWLELSAREYYTWSGWFFTHDSDADMVMAKSLYPIMDDACGIGISLDWCREAARNLDLFMFLPLNGTGQVQSDNRHLVHWKNASYEPTPGNYVEVTYNDRGQTFGPDSKYMVGTLPLGTYAVLVHSETRHSKLDGNCATVSLSAGATEQGHVTSVTIGSKGAKGSWWYALNVHVELQSSQAILFSYSIVDQIINPGPAMDAGVLVGSFPVPLAQVRAQKKTEMFSLLKSRRECGIFGLLGVVVIDARTGLQLTGASYTLDEDPTVYDVDSNLVVADGTGYRGGLSYFEGEHAVSVSRAGYVPRVKTVTIMKGNVPTYAEIFLVAVDNQTHMVLTWGNSPADLDLVVLPRGVATFEKQPVSWNGPDGDAVRSRQPCEEPYLWNGVADVNCSCARTGEGSCDPVCYIEAGLTGAYVPRISLDREESRHGSVGSDGFVTNKPETLTFEKLMAGDYDVFATAARSASMVGTVTLDVYLGDGARSIEFTVAEGFRATGESWVHLGTLRVFSTSRGCEGTSKAQAPQDGMITLLCYSWQSALQPTSYPLRQVDRVGFDLRDAATGLAVPRPTITIDGYSYSASATDLVSIAGPRLRGGFLFGSESQVQASASDYVTTSIRLEYQECRLSVFNVAVFMVPADGRTRVVARWGDFPVDLDVYVLPRGVTDLSSNFISWSGASGGQPSTWNTNEDPYVWYEELAITSSNGAFATRISLDRDDATHGTVDPVIGRPANGPETVTFQQLLPGEYEVYVNANPPDESRSNRTAVQVFGDRFDVEVYLGDGVSSTLQVDTVVVSAPGDVWRYVGYIRVYLRSGSGCEGVSRLQSPIGGVELCYQWIRANLPVAYPLEGVGVMKALVLSASPSVPLGRVGMIIDGQTRVFRPADFGLQTRGLFIPQGQRTITVESEGFISQTVQRELQSYTLETVTLVFFLVPFDGRTRVVLRWGDTPMDLDLYVVPRRTVDMNGMAVRWRDGPGGTWGPDEPPYAWYNQTTIEAQVDGYVPSISLDRDDVEHGQIDEAAGIALNGPETTTLERLLPGDYEVYVNAWPPDGERNASEVFDGPIEVDVYLGNGADTSLFRASATWTAPGDVWRFVGYISVYVVTGGEQCRGVSQEQAALVDGNRVCYEWIEVNQRIEYPLGPPPLIRVRAEDAVTGSAIAGATFFVNNDLTTLYTASDLDVGLSVIPGDYPVTVMGSGYVTRTFTLQASPVGRTVYLVPDDGHTRVVLSWTGGPENLDIYVVPTEVLTCQNESALWVAPGYIQPRTVRAGEAPYVWHRERTLIVGNGRNITSLYEYEYEYNYTEYNYTEYNYTEYNYTEYNYTEYNYTEYNYTMEYNYTEYNYTMEYNYTEYSYTYNVTTENATNATGGVRRLLQATSTSPSVVSTPVPPETTSVPPVPLCSGLPDNNTHFVTRLQLNRNASHSTNPDADGYLVEKPEVVTLTDLLPGKYLVYVNAYPPEGLRTAGQEFSGPFALDVYLGDGVNITKLSTALRLDVPGFWRYVGWLEAGIPSEEEECTGIRRMQQEKVGPGLGFCYTWSTTSLRVDYPLS